MIKIRSREELLNLATRFNVSRYPDGRINKIEAFQKAKLIHTTQAVYSTVAGLTRLTDVQGFLFDEIWNSVQTQQLAPIDRNPKRIFLTSKAYKGTADMPFASTDFNYQVPANRKAIVELMWSRVTSSAVATTGTGRAIAKIEYTLPNIQVLTDPPMTYAELVEPSAVNTTHLSEIQNQIMLAENDTLTAYSSSTMNGDGLFTMRNVLKLIEFDA